MARFRIMTLMLTLKYTTSMLLYFNFFVVVVFV